MLAFAQVTYRVIISPSVPFASAANSAVVLVRYLASAVVCRALTAVELEAIDVENTSSGREGDIWDTQRGVVRQRQRQWEEQSMDQSLDSLRETLERTDRTDRSPLGAVAGPWCVGSGVSKDD